MSKYLQALQTFFWAVPFFILITFFARLLNDTLYPIHRHPKTIITPSETELILSPPTLNITSVFTFRPFENTKTILQPHLNSSMQTSKLRPPSKSFLCKLNLEVFCTSSEVAEVIESFWVVCPIYAPYQSANKIRYQLHQSYKGYIESIGMSFSTLEAIRKDRNQEFLMTRAGREPYDIQLEFYEDVYLRENYLNVAARKIKDWEYMAWIDTHQIFENIYWWEETIVRTEKNASVQIFQYFLGTDPSNVTDILVQSALYKSLLQDDLDAGPPIFYGNAYAIRKEVYDEIEYIFDRCIATCCDCAYVLASLPERIPFRFYNRWSKYTDQMLPWVENTKKVFKGSRSIVRGFLFHIYHENTIPYFDVLNWINGTNFDMNNDLKRDDNFTLRFYNQDLENRLKWTIWWGSFHNLVYKILYYVIPLLTIACSCLLYKITGYYRRKKQEQQHSNA